MAYCRWSCLDYQSDVYCYESVAGGFEIHVAGIRYAFSAALPDPVSMQDGEKWVARHKRVMEIISRSRRVHIDHPLAGRYFTEKTAIDAAARLIKLRISGFNVPQYAIDNLLAEDAENNVDQATQPG